MKTNDTAYTMRWCSDDGYSVWESDDGTEVHFSGPDGEVLHRSYRPTEPVLPKERFWLKATGMAAHYEVTKEVYISAERAAGFHSKFGPDHPATAAFSGGSIEGQTWEPKK